MSLFDEAEISADSPAAKSDLKVLHLTVAGNSKASVKNSGKTFIMGKSYVPLQRRTVSVRNAERS